MRKVFNQATVACLTVMFSYDCFKVAFPTALTLGSVYFIINHGLAVVYGEFSSARIIPAILQYFIPYCVCAYGYAQKQSTNF